MKKTVIAFGILFLFSFLSCSSDDSNSSSNAVKKPISISVETSEGYTWTYGFIYSNNLITRLTNSSGGTTEFEYDLDDRLILIQGSNGKSYYNYSNNLLSSITYIGIRNYTRRTDFTYNDLNQIKTSITNENNEYDYIYFYEYDELGRLVKSTNESGDSANYEYDNRNNPFKNVYPQMSVRHSFSWINPLINNVLVDEQIYADNLSYEYIYDSENYPVSIKEIASDGTVNVTSTITYE